MNVEKKDLGKAQVELLVELSAEEFKPYYKKGLDKVSHEVKIDGFRPGHIPEKMLKEKVGEMAILEEAARIAINKTVGEVIEKNVKRYPVGQPKVDIVKLAPGNPLVYKVVLALLPSVELGEYQGLKIKNKKAEVSEEEIAKALSDLQEMRVKEVLVDRAVRDTDKVLVDIEMFLDNVPIDGGQSKDTAVVIGRDYIIPGFGKQLVGAKKGDTKEFKLPYPEEHNMKNLAGKMVDFKIKIKDVFERQLPVLDDELAKGFGLKNLAELKDSMKKNIEHQKFHEAEQSVEREMLEKLINKTKFGDIPEMLIDHETKNMMAELEQTVAAQGGKFEDYLGSIKKTRDQLMLDLVPDAIKRVKTSILIRELAIKEKITVEKEEIKKQIDEIKAHYEKMPKEQAGEALARINNPDYQNYVANVLMSRKVVGKLREWNVVD